ncbi:MAG TPA: hypothetical protein VG917_01085, partial [Patescibacteria group bacterium]|nr:hypothetical protein [Patescibacteria group bacterium]
MFTLVLSGNSEAKNDFIEKFIKDEKIPSYNIYKFADGLKISDAREVKKVLSLKPVGGNRLIIIGEEPSVESQNALLKTIEELPDDTFFIFLSEKLLLPTIISRVKIINVGNSLPLESTIIELNKNYSVSESILIVDKFFSSNKGNDPYSDMILALRNKIISDLSKNNIQEVYVYLKMIKKLFGHFSLVKFNNLNPRNAAER